MCIRDRFYTEMFHIEPRLVINYNFNENSVYSVALNIELEQYDYGYADRFGWFGNLGLIYNNQNRNNIGSSFNSSFTLGSYLTVGGGLILNLGENSNPIKAGGFFEYGLNQLSNSNAINFGIQLNYFLFDIGCFWGIVSWSF